MSAGAILSVLLPISFWNVWLWYFERLSDRSDEPFGILALIVLVAIQFVRRRDETSCQKTHFWIAVAFAFLYLLSTFYAPKIIQAFCALISLSLFLNMTGIIKRLCYGDYLLMGLSLPVVASLNFYIGYPLRLLVSQAACVLLNIAGLAVTVQSTALSLGGQTVEIDAPCGGVKMLWLSLFIAATLCSYFCFSLKNTFLLTLIAVVTALLANVTRVTGLFYVETGLVSGIIFDQEKFVHQAIGVFSFAFVALTVILCAKKILASEKLQEEARKEEKAFDSRPSKAAPTIPAYAVSISFLLVTFIAVVPFISSWAFAPLSLSSASSVTAGTKFPGWPAEFEGMKLVNEKLSPAEKEFLAGFPGQAAVFSCGEKKVILRWIVCQSRQVHSASDCFRGSGYDIEYLPVIIDKNGKRWGHFKAVRKAGLPNQHDEVLDVREQIYDNSGKSWNDISAWYWNAELGKAKAPFWSVSVISR